MTHPPLESRCSDRTMQGAMALFDGRSHLTPQSATVTSWFCMGDVCQAKTHHVLRVPLRVCSRLFSKSKPIRYCLARYHNWSVETPLHSMSRSWLAVSSSRSGRSNSYEACPFRYIHAGSMPQKIRNPKALQGKHVWYESRLGQ